MIMAVVALLTIAPAASAQTKIKEAFEHISKIPGLAQMGDQKSSVTDSSGISCESRVLILKVGRDNFPAVFDKLKTVFDDESGKATWYYTHTHNADSTATYRQQWSVWRDGTTPVLVGAIKNSSFLIANFNDTQRPGYRTCYAAEWSDTNDPDTRQAQLTYVYGHKPEAKDNGLLTQYFGKATWPKELKDLPPSMSMDDMKQWAEEVRATFGSKPKDIPFKDGDTQTWMKEAMKNVKHLSASDWHRFFGILTQQMINHAQRESAEDLVVAAGLVLDLCKNADQLDDDERKLSANRLTEVAKNFTASHQQYIHDLLMLAAKKLRSK